MSRLLALDPGTTRTGWAMFDGRRLVDAGVLVAHGRDLDRRVRQIVLDVTALIRRYWPDVVAIERSPETRGGRIRALAALARLSGALEALAITAGATVVPVNPNAWQQAVLRCGPRATREGRKRASVRVAEALTGRKMAEDAADAVLLGYHVAGGIKR